MGFSGPGCEVEWDELITFVTGSNTTELDESNSSTFQSQNNAKNLRFNVFFRFQDTALNCGGFKCRMRWENE
jgi:hypothetical protein